MTYGRKNNNFLWVFSTVIIILLNLSYTEILQNNKKVSFSQQKNGHFKLSPYIEICNTIAAQKEVPLCLVLYLEMI